MKSAREKLRTFFSLAVGFGVLYPYLGRSLAAVGTFFLFPLVDMVIPGLFKLLGGKEATRAKAVEQIKAGLLLLGIFMVVTLICYFSVGH